MPKLLKKSQLWYYDLALALSLFLVIIAIAFMYVKDDTVLKQKETGILIDAKALSDMLMTEGVPKDWNLTNVIIPGIVDEGYVSIAKAEMLSNLTREDFDSLKLKYGIIYDFAVEFYSKGEEKLNLTSEISSSLNRTISEELVQIERYIAYRHDNTSEIIAMRVIMWK